MIKIVLYSVGEEKEYLLSALKILGKQENGVLVLGVISKQNKKISVDGHDVPLLNKDDFLMKREWNYWLLVENAICQM